MTRKRLFEKVYGCLIGSSIGDAMGAPVEMMSRGEIRKKYGYVDDFLPLSEAQIGPHGAFGTEKGSYTDDSRMMKLLCREMMEKHRHLTKEDVKHCMIKAYHRALEPLEKEFLEEYYYKAVYDDKKTVFGGQPTNGTVMCTAPFGVMNPCNPVQAFYETYDAMFFAEGYARYSAPIVSAVIAEAFYDGNSVKRCIDKTLRIARCHKQEREGNAWRGWVFYDKTAEKNETMIEQALKASEEISDEAFYQALYDMTAMTFFADGAETAAVGLAMASRAENFQESVLLSINYGRDCDSSASVAGAVTGALYGIEDIPKSWVEQVEKVNPGPSFFELSEKLCDIIESNYGAMKEQYLALRKFMEDGENGESM